MSKQNGGVYKSPIRTTSKDDVPVVKNTIELNFEGANLNVVDDGCGKATVTSNPQNSSLGKEHGYEFFNNGANIKDKWFDIVGASIPCNDTPGVVTADGKLRSLSYSNNRNNSNIILEIYKNGTDPGDLVFTWVIDGCRTAWKTNGLDAITFAAGDEIRLFAKGTPGTAPSKAVVKIIMINTTDDVEEGCNPTLL